VPAQEGRGNRSGVGTCLLCHGVFHSEEGDGVMVVVEIGSP
jgi:hypothetical protein